MLLGRIVFRSVEDVDLGFVIYLTGRWLICGCGLRPAPRKARIPSADGPV